LLDLERLKGAQKFFSTANGDLLVERVRFAGKIELGCKMDDRGDARAVGCPYAPQAGRYGFFRSQIDAHALRGRRGLMCGGPIKANEAELISESIDEGRANEPGAPRDNDYIFVLRHGCTYPHLNR